jgi:hypothetical protein
MKKLRNILMSVLFILGLTCSSFAATTVTTPVTATAGGALSIRLAPIADGFSTNGSLISFSVDVDDYLVNWCPADQTVTGQSDVGVYCMSNSGSTWYLKMKIADTTGTLGTAPGVYRFINGATNRNTGLAANGTVAFNNVWHKIDTADEVTYSSGTNDTVNTPFGTCIGVTYSLQSLVGVNTGVAYASTITYTITLSA